MYLKLKHLRGSLGASVTAGCGVPLTHRAAVPLLCPSGLHVPGEVERPLRKGRLPPVYRDIRVPRESPWGKNWPPAQQNRGLGGEK